MPSNARCLLACALTAGAFSLLSSTALAGTVTLTTPNPQRTPVDALVDHPADLTGISLDDCEKDIQLSFGTRIDDITGTEALQVWAGPADCADAQNRPGGANPVCYPVTPAFAQLFTSMTIVVKGRDIAAHLFPGAAPITAGYQPADASACQAPASAPPAAVHTALQFLFRASDGTFTPSGATYPLDVDLVGPPAPCDAALAHDGAQALKATWSDPISPDVYGFRVYCTPQPGHESAPATAPEASDVAGVPGTCSNPPTPAGDEDAGAAAAGECTSAFADAHDPSRLGSFVCEDVVGNVVGSYAAKNLVAGTSYSFAVAAIDRMGNASRVVPAGCGQPSAQPAPTPTTTASGSGCSTAQASSADSAASLAPIGAALLGIVALARRRRRAARRDLTA